MKNKLGQRLTRKDLREFWGEAQFPAQWSRADAFDFKELLNVKACNVFYERLRDAENAGASEEELARIDTKDVKLNIGDVLRNWVLCTRSGIFFSDVVRFYTEEPDYSGVLPCG